MSVDELSATFVHPTKALLEEYCFKRVAEPALSALEEHLLICARCRNELVGTEQYIRLFKAALRDRPLPADSAPPKPSPFWLDFHPIPHVPIHAARLAGIAVVLLLVAMIPLARRGGLPQDPTRIELFALRGGPSAQDGQGTGHVNLSRRGQLAKASSSTPLELVIDRQRLSGSQGYVLRVVDAEGRETWSGPATATGNFLSAHIGRTFRRGVYWARLYSDRSDLISEYGLEID